MMLNCIIIDDDKLSRRIIEEFISKTEDLNLLQSFSGPVEAIKMVNNHSQEEAESVDLIFLDIEMPEMSGLDFLDTIKDLPQIIIISSKDKYALNAFEYDVTDYLLKPITYSRFFKAITKAQSRYKKSRIESKGNEIFIKKNSSLVRLKYDDILWVEALENYVIFNTYNEKFTIHFTMKSIEKKLPVNKFTRVHRSFIVNTSCINVIEDNSIVINIEDGFKTIPIGKSYKDKLMSDINLIAK
ncbi:MAG: LytTR family DNA-binding domain-containing protein [Bacteroidota bacterium]|nr:LytTR family DNA-binding domain-containing protein [Bacteroidota bacterium]MDP4225067.1 LytTR family DNA-binding domain-containing protein [Bacteroidota bacterium]MDP4273074.1 LytTR family DNA-binding domain-containing protein [Bacteroidota bacterium]